MSNYVVETFRPEYADKLILFANQQPLIWADLSSIATTKLAEPKVWLALSDAGVIEAAAIDDGLAMNIAGTSNDAVEAIANNSIDLDTKLVITGRTDEVKQLTRSIKPKRKERIEHFMSIGKDNLSMLIEPIPIRIANEDDLPLLRTTRVAALEEEYGMQVPEGSKLYTELSNAVQRAVQLNGVAIWVEDNKCAFTAQLIAKTPEASMFGDLYVDPSLRGKGRATRALTAFCAWLMYESKNVTLRVGVENTPAVRLYERVGFSVIDEFCSSLSEPEH